MPRGLTWAKLKEELISRGLEIETTGVFLQMRGLPIVDSFEVNPDE